MNNLLAAIDFSTSTDGVIEESCRLAKALDAKLWVLHVASDEAHAVTYETSSYSDLIPDISNMPADVQLARDLSAEELKREHRELLGLSSKLKSEGVTSQAILVKGNAAKEIVSKANDIDADIILLGSHGHGLLHKALLGSVSESIIRHAPCKIMIIPSPKE